MEDTMNIIRESRRNLEIMSRRGRREKDLDARRSLKVPDNFSKENVLNIANKLKTRTLISIEELSYLKDSFSEDEEFVSTFLTVNGALRGLIRELTGTSALNKVCAATCLCNMSVWSSSTTKVVAQVATAYMHTGLDSFNSEITITSAWYLGNIASAYRAGLSMLGSHTKLLGMLDTHTHLQARDAALYATTHIVRAMGSTAQKEYIQKCIQIIITKEVTLQSTQLLFFLSCYKNFIDLIDLDFIKYICNNFLIYMEKHINKCSDIKEYICCELIYILRILGNTCQVPSSNCNVILEFLITNNCFDGLKKILTDLHTEEYCLWFLGNIYNFAVDSEFKVLFFNQLIQ